MGDLQRGLAAVALFEAEHGAFSDAELAEADRILDAVGVVDLRNADVAKAPETTGHRNPTPSKQVRSRAGQLPERRPKKR